MSRDRTKWKYPKQQVVTLSTEVDAVLRRIADEQGLTKTEVSRALIHDGLRRQGYHVATSDKRAPRVEDFAASTSGEPAPIGGVDQGVNGLGVA